MQVQPAFGARATAGLAMILSLLVACSSPSPTATPTPNPFGGFDIEDVVITLERTMCLGHCPDYSLTIHGDGTVEYEGKYWVAVEGAQTATISKEQVSQLVEAFDRINYFSLKDRYECYEIKVHDDGTEACLKMMDLPSTSTSIKIGDLYKTVYNYDGAPTELYNLENLIDVVTNTSVWVHGESAAVATSKPTAAPTPVHVSGAQTQELKLRPGWTSYTNANYVSDMAFDQDGNLWTVGSGGVVQWNLTDGTYTKYTVEHGLAENQIHTVAVDTSGALWFGSDDSGVSRFDGDTWTTYTTADGLAHNTVKTIAVDPDGALWFGTEGGVSCFDGDTWINYSTADGLSANVVNAIAVESADSLWFGTGSGVSRFDGETWIAYTNDDGPRQNSVESILVAPDGGLWFGSRGSGVFHFDGKVWTTHSTWDGLASYDITAIGVEPNGAVWFSTAGDGVSRFDLAADGIGGGHAWTTYTTDDGLVSDYIASIAVAPDGAMWFGAARHGSSGGDPRWGISRFDGQTWTTYTTDDGLADNRVTSIAATYDGIMWFATGLGGVSRYADPNGNTADEEAWTSYSADDGLGVLWVASVAAHPDGSAWFGTLGPVYRFDATAEAARTGQAWTYYTTDDGLAGQFVSSIVVGSDGALWFGTKGGVSRFDGESWTTHTTDEGLADDDVQAIAVAPDGKLWFGTDNGVSSFDGQNWITYTTTDGLADNDIASIAVTPDGTMWFGTQGEAWSGTIGKGVSRFDGKTWITYTTVDGLADDAVNAIAVTPDGGVWFGTEDGASHFDGKTWTTYATTDGLADRRVNAIHVDPNGAIWFGTEGGVSRYSPVDVAAGEIREPIPTSPAKPLYTATPVPTPTPEPTFTAGPLTATPLPLSPCQQIVADVEALWTDYPFPDHFLEADAVKTGEEFDVNAYFSVLDHLSVQPGYILDYVYHYDGMGGSPMIYAKSEGQDPYVTFSEYYTDTIGDLTWQEWFEVSRFGYMDHIQVDDSEEGFFQYVVLRKMAAQFYLFWHANYNDDWIICDQGVLEELLADLAEPEMVLALPPELQDQARALDLEPWVQIGEDIVEVRVVIFTLWGGFIEERYAITRSFPHKVVQEETETLVPYDCGILF